MKKLLSIVLSVAMLMTIMSAMAVMPTTAGGTNLLDNPLSDEGDGLGTHVYENGVLTITATGESTVGVAVATPLPISSYPFVDVVIDSEVDFDILFIDKNNGKSMFAAGDFCWAFEGGTTSAIPAGSHNVRIDLSGAYTWTGNPVPENANLDTIYLIPKAAGTMTVSKLEQTDGNIFSSEAMNTYEATEDLAIKDVDAWTGIPVSGSKVTVTTDGDALVLGNTNAQWPSAFIDFETPYVVDPDAMIYADFTVAAGAKTTIYLFFKDADCNNFSNGAYCTIGAADMPAGTYGGYVALADLIPSTDLCCDEDGNIVITGIKIFATSEGADAVDPAVTINALDLLYTPTEEVLVGDFTGDDVVNMRDIMLLYKAASSGDTMTDAQVAACDYDGNGIVNMRDVMMLYKKVSTGA